MTEQELKAVEARFGRVTPGGWHRRDAGDHRYVYAGGPGDAVRPIVCRMVIPDVLEDWQIADNADFIAAAPADVAALAAEVRLLRSLLDDAAGLDGTPVERLERYRRALARIAALEGYAGPPDRDAITIAAEALGRG